MKNTVLVSVVMPVFNAREYLPSAMDSLLAQTLTDFEIVCVDDGSTDDSLTLLKTYQKQDERVRIVAQTNAGVSCARNVGLKRARGEYVVFFDADDVAAPSYLKDLYDVASEDNLDIVICEYDLIRLYRNNGTKHLTNDKDSSLKPGIVASQKDLPNEIFQATDGYVWNKMFSTAFLRQKSLQFPENIRVFEDVCFICEALSLAERVEKIKPVLLHHRVYAGQGRVRLFRRYYSAFPEMLVELKAFLTKRGMFLPLSVSFIRLSASRCYYIYNILWEDAKAAFWDLLHETYAGEFGWRGAESREIEGADVFRFIASVSLYSYKESLTNAKRGVGARLGDYLTDCKRFLQRKKVKSFFGKLFGKKPS